MTDATIDEPLIDRLLSGAVHPHELPWPLWLLWSHGFRSGCERMQSRLDRANADADHWYAVANNPAEHRKRHEAMLRDFDIAQARKTTAEKWAALDHLAAERAEASRG